MLPFPLLRAAPSGPSLSGGVPDAHSERWIIPQGIQKGEKTSVVQNMIASLTLVDKLQSRQAKVGIIGLGYVGLPLAVAFAEAGFSVLGIDSDEARVISLNAGRSHIPDISWERLAALAPSGDRLASAVSAGSGGSAQQHQDEWSKPHAGGLFATTDYQVLSEVDVAIICVPTPLSKTKDPDLSFILAATEEIVRHLHPGMLVVLESSSCQGSKVPMG